MSVTPKPSSIDVGTTPADGKDASTHIRTADTESKGRDIDAPNPELRGRFAIALCKAHHIGAEDGSTPCQEGLTCSKKDVCLDLADKTLSYARDLQRGTSTN